MIFRPINNIHIPLFFHWSGLYIKPRFPREGFIHDCDAWVFSTFVFLVFGQETTLRPVYWSVFQGPPMPKNRKIFAIQPFSSGNSAPDTTNQGFRRMIMSFLCREIWFPGSYHRSFWQNLPECGRLSWWLKKWGPLFIRLFSSAVLIQFLPG
jgi:hypothetical protein